jgi:hypothetical protein
MTMDDYYVYVRKKMFVLLNNVKPMIIQGVEGPGLQPPATSVSAIGDDMTTNVVESNGDDDNSSMSCNRSTSRNSSLEGSVTVSSGVDAAHEDQLLITDEQGDIYDQADDGGDMMPDDWMFPGFITFALLGPIVPPTLIPYRSEILMAGLPPMSPGDTSTNGRAATRKTERNNKRKATDVVATAAVASGVPATDQKQEVSLQHRIMVAGIAQSKMLMEQRQNDKANDRVIAFHQKKVSAQRMLLNEVKFMISITPRNDPEYGLLMRKLIDMNEALSNAATELMNAEETIMKNACVAQEQGKVATFIDLTIASVLGMDDENEESLDTAEADSTSTMRATPLSSNKKTKATTERNHSAPSLTSRSLWPSAHEASADDVSKNGTEERTGNDKQKNGHV